jgi:hypothetical protein
MAISAAVRAYYEERIFKRTTRGGPPPNFRPLDAAPTGVATVEGCRGGGKNILEVRLVGDDEQVTDVRLSCGLCNPAMLVAADILADWTRGRRLADVLAPDAADEAALAPFFEALGGAGRPDDAREKFQYALLAVQNAVRNHQGAPTLPVPVFSEPDP